MTQSEFLYDPTDEEIRENMLEQGQAAMDQHDYYYANNHLSPMSDRDDDVPF
jgi:hypothetical protein